MERETGRVGDTSRALFQLVVVWREWVVSFSVGQHVHLSSRVFSLLSVSKQLSFSLGISDLMIKLPVSCLFLCFRWEYQTLESLPRRFRGLLNEIRQKHFVLCDV